MEKPGKQGKYEPIKGGERMIKAKLKVATFIGKGDAKHDEEVNNFLSTIDNQSRFLNGRNVYAMGDKSVVQIWYLEQLVEASEVESFGKKEKKNNVS